MKELIDQRGRQPPTPHLDITRISDPRPRNSTIICNRQELGVMNVCNLPLPLTPPLTTRELYTGTGPNRNPSLTLPRAEPMQGSRKTYSPGHTEERKWWRHLLNVKAPGSCPPRLVAILFSLIWHISFTSAAPRCREGQLKGAAET